MFAKPLEMYKYRETLYRNYYSTHSGTTNTSAQFSHFEQQVRYFKMEFEKLLPPNKESKILDIGCGTGSLIKGLNELGFNNTAGVDLSEEQVAMSKTFGVEGIIHADSRDYLSDKNNSFDIIFAVDLIEHLGKDELVDFLAMIKKALKPNGLVFFRTPNMDCPHAAVFAFADFTHEVFLNKSSSIQLMESSGFKDVKVSEGIVFIESPLKEFIRKIGWSITKLTMKLQLFFSARTWHEVLFTPNIVIQGKNSKE